MPLPSTFLLNQEYNTKIPGLYADRQGSLNPTLPEKHKKLKGDERKYVLKKLAHWRSYEYHHDITIPNNIMDAVIIVKGTEYRVGDVFLRAEVRLYLDLCLNKGTGVLHARNFAICLILSAFPILGLHDALLLLADRDEEKRLFALEAETWTGDDSAEVKNLLLRCIDGVVGNRMNKNKSHCDLIFDQNNRMFWESWPYSNSLWDELAAEMASDSAILTNRKKLREKVWQYDTSKEINQGLNETGKRRAAKQRMENKIRMDLAIIMLGSQGQSDAGSLGSKEVAEKFNLFGFADAYGILFIDPSSPKIAPPQNRK